ncbi:helix-turn-helix domain-containing protein [Phytoactinopolyspora halotolerans]|uniref:Helix-turn-helix transcriptional regulator n=1 Tax=Phytoactinopolyspora halotolerans TaxID=1981512 RepID=A0A6L9SJ26_9ACTN|nr:helix-turn-helix transcriptional regulator [Phytoactinopolyspora halotolerans]NEE04412.1 helix-turn-helix transcriptional regulator [Phytoactinopolyspora halotolerans]
MRPVEAAETGAAAAELGAFLRSRRGRLTPEDVGLIDYGERRRVPGLRREELAQLAGVSVGYYTRLEQGVSTNASDTVLDAIARALRLNDDERTHLHRLAQQKSKPRRRRRPERLRPEVARMVGALHDAPALVLGRRLDVLAWNRMAHALLAGHLDPESPERPADRPNWVRLFFLDPHVRDLFVDWQRKARNTVADLRVIAGRYPDDAELAELVGELTMKSDEFATLWSAHPVQRCAHHTQTYRHPTVGDLTLADELLEFPDDDGQRLVIFHAEPGSPSEAGLKLLGTGVASGNPRVPGRTGQGAARTDT